MIDGAVLAGYLVVAATRSTGRVFAKGVDALFDGLARRVEERLGARAVMRLQSEPDDAALLARLGREIDAVARTDPQLARELAGLQHELDRKVGRQFIWTLTALSSVGSTADRSDSDRSDSDRSPSGLSDSVSRARRG